MSGEGEGREGGGRAERGRQCSHRNFAVGVHPGCGASRADKKIPLQCIGVSM